MGIMVPLRLAISMDRKSDKPTQAAAIKPYSRVTDFPKKRYPATIPKDTIPIKRPLQHQWGIFKTACNAGDNAVTSSNTTGTIPSSPLNELMFTIINHSAHNDTLDTVYADGQSLRIHAQLAQTIQVAWHRFVGGGNRQKYCCDWRCCA